MKVALVTSVSQRIADYAALTVPNKYAYCMRHGYSMVVDNRPYEEAVADVAWLTHLFDHYQMLWVLDADAVITKLSVPIHTLPCLGPHVTVCKEGIVQWNLINCGSMVYRATDKSAELLRRITASRQEWSHLPCGWQTWLADKREELGDTLAIAPLRAFNSCAWNHAAGAPGNAGSNWHPGDFVFHANGFYPLSERARVLRHTLEHDVQE